MIKLKIFLILFLASISANIGFAENIIELEQQNLNLEAQIEDDKYINPQNKILQGTAQFLDTIHNGIDFEEGIIKHTKFGFYYDGGINLLRTSERELGSTYTIPAVEVFNKTQFRDGKTELETMYNFSRDIEGYDNYFSEKISVLTLSRKIGENQKILIGQGSRSPIGVEGSYSTFNQDMVQKSQIARTFSNVRSVGIRNQGDYKYIDYDIGIYDSTRFFQDFFNGMDFTGWVNVKPLAGKEKYGNLTLGGGYNAGHYRHDYSVLGAYAGYSYKKVHAKFEYANANGYNGMQNSTNKADGYYTTLLYDITPKLQLAARYDFFDPNKHIHHNNSTEYGLGLVYNITKDFKLYANYVFRDSQNMPDENRIMLATRFLI